MFAFELIKGEIVMKKFKLNYSNDEGLLCHVIIEANEVKSIDNLTITADNIKITFPNYEEIFSIEIMP